jgi:hypothetical protein
LVYDAMKVAAEAVKPVTAAIPSVVPPLAYDFAQQLVLMERKFAEDMLHLATQFAPAKPAPHK